MKRAVLVAALVAAPVVASAQSLATSDPILRRIWAIGMDSSQAYPLAQALMDSIGPRLTGTPGQRAGHAWLIQKYREWGIPAREERYGVWKGWRRGVTHVDLIQPRVRTLEATILAWSPGTPGGAPVEGGIAIIPDVQSRAELDAWLPQARGRFVLIAPPQQSCRPDESWQQWADSNTYRRMRAERTAEADAWNARLMRATGDSSTTLATRALPGILQGAGAAGVLTSNWPNTWGTRRVFNARLTQRIPTVDLGCEDYGLLFRLAENRQAPRIRVQAEAQDLGEVPVFNVLGEIRGTERPDEYVMLSAHFDSYDGASGATDNGTGTIVMLEAMRILKRVLPNPKRTILVAHWSGEEQGLVGSRAFAADHPEIVRGLQALFNQDNGTGRIVEINGSGFLDATAHLAGWMSRLPREITRHIKFGFVGYPPPGGTDYASFICAGAPAFDLEALNWDYRNYTWHTDRDTFDKIVFDDLRNNIVLTAMLAYLASEDPVRVGRQRAEHVFSPTGRAAAWPECQLPPRKPSEWTR